MARPRLPPRSPSAWAARTWPAVFIGGILAGFVGEQDQVPPAYSAISVDGQRSYALAREGKAPELAARRITVFSAKLVEIASVEGQLSWVVDFDVSKGTYVRSLARDIGRAAGSAAHLVALRRTQSGSVGLDACLALDAVDAAQDSAEVLAHALDPVAALGAPVRQLSAQEAADAACGKVLAAGTVRMADGTERAPLPGERIGWVLVPPTNPDHDRLVYAIAGAGRSLGFVCAPALFQRVVADCCDVPSDVEAYTRNREALTRGLSELGYHYIEPQGAFYLWVKALEPDANAFFERAKALELLPVPSDSFGCTGWVRIGYCVSYETIVNSMPAWKKLAESYK